MKYNSAVVNFAFKECIWYQYNYLYNLSKTLSLARSSMLSRRKYTATTIPSQLKFSFFFSFNFVNKHFWLVWRMFSKAVFLFSICVFFELYFVDTTTHSDAYFPVIIYRKTTDTRCTFKFKDEDNWQRHGQWRKIQTDKQYYGYKTQHSFSDFSGKDLWHIIKRKCVVKVQQYNSKYVYVLVYGCSNVQVAKKCEINIKKKCGISTLSKQFHRFVGGYIKVKERYQNYVSKMTKFCF